MKLVGFKVAIFPVTCVRVPLQGCLIQTTRHLPSVTNLTNLLISVQFELVRAFKRWHYCGVRGAPATVRV